MAKKSEDTFKTMGKLAAHFYEFNGDDEGEDKECVITVSDIRDNGEIEILWHSGEVTHYLDFRLSDLQRALRELRAAIEIPTGEYDHDVERIRVMNAETAKIKAEVSKRRQIAKWVRLHPRSERRFALELAKQQLPACWEGQ